MIIDLSTVGDVQYDHVGGKGYNLHRLLKAGLPVPRAAVIRPQSIDVDVLINKLKTLEWIDSASLYAVRSSGVGEDSQEKSWAGIFDSYLFIEPDNIAHHVQKVIDSMDATRYKKYSTESGIEIGSMAVIVQEMIHAEYAGVTFTTSPIEGDDRIALIEVVEGVGESLVSSQKTPATLRVNKMTDIARIQQAGDDSIEEEVLIKICELLMPYMHEIERLYGQPMDVEWAIKDEKVFILQARPITTI